VVIEVTEVELEKIYAGSLLLPEGWRLGELIWQPAAGSLTPNPAILI